MIARNTWKRIGLIGVVAAMAAAPTASAQDSTESTQDSTESAQDENVLKIGWAQNPRTLNPFVGQDEESFTVWAMTWDLLVNFSPEDLSPTPGIAESWEVSDDKQTLTFHLDPNKTWSDGEPVTSEDIKYSLETLGGEGALFTGYTDNVKSIETPDDQTVVIKTKRPDSRILGGLYIYILPEHVWGEVPVDELTGSYQPDIPMVGSGPFVVTEYQPGRFLRMEQNPEWDGPQPEFDEIQFIRYGNQDAAERALQLGEVDLVPEVSAANFERLGGEPDIETVQSPQPGYTQLAFNLCSEDICPDAEVNPAIQELDVRQATAYSIDRERINAIAAQGTSFVAHGILPSWYSSYYEVPEDDYPYDPEMAKQILDDAGWVESDDGPRTRGDEELSFNLYVRSESQYNVQAAKLVAEMAADVGIEFDVQVVSTDKLYDLTIREVDGKQAPAFDTFIWGWGGDPYDPGFLLSLLTTDQIGGSSDSFYSNPEFDKLYEQQSGEFDTEARKELIQRMVAITQRDLPYLVLTEDPNLQAYRTDRLADVERVCPSETGDTFCEFFSYEPLLTLAPAGGSDDDGGGSGSGTVVVVAVGVLVLGAIAYFVVRSRRHRNGEPLELEE